MKLLPALIAAALSAAAPAFAATLTLDFEGATSFESIRDFYNGGTDSAGASGANLGVSFGDDALALANDAAGSYFANNPSGSTVMAVVGTNAALNFATGFSGQVAFQYSSSGDAQQAVQVWSGLNGTGTLLASADLSNNATAGGCSGDFCHWDLAAITFKGVAQSVTFAAPTAAGSAKFDDVTITAVPEPSQFALLLAGLSAVGLVVRRRR